MYRTAVYGTRIRWAGLTFKGWNEVERLAGRWAWEKNLSASWPGEVREATGTRTPGEFLTRRPTQASLTVWGESRSFVG